MIIRLSLILATLILATSLLLAGEIFGTIRENSKPVKKGIKVEITTAKKTDSTETDNYGSYRLFVTEKGKCTLKIHFNKQTPTFEVYSYDKSTRYDFIIEKKDTTYNLKRK